MSFTSWPRNSKRSAPAARRRRETPAGQRASFPARLDALEGRRLFSTLTVTSANDSGAGSLRAEIAAAQSGDTIVFAPTLTLSTGSSKPHRGGTTTTSKTITLTGGELDLTKSLTIQGPGAGQLTITGTSSTTTSHGGHKTTTTTSSQVFEVAQSTTLTLSGLTISNGNTYAGGGGIHNSGTVTVSSCTLSGHVGGAISNSGGTATVINSTVSGNNGGGIYNSGGTLTISGSSLSGNFAYSGGGIY